MTIVNIHEAKTHLSRYVEQAAAGEEIIIAKAGKPVARLVPLETQALPPRKLGLLAGKLKVADDFDDPLPDELLDLFLDGPIFPPAAEPSPLETP
jgi:prevent-host-death family protein